jgi:ABC-2 type transport system permease protein
MRAAWTIAREEWRLLLRDRVAVLAMALWLLLSAAAAFTAWDQRSAAQAQRERHPSLLDG